MFTLSHVEREFTKIVGIEIEIEMSTIAQESQGGWFIDQKRFFVIRCGKML